MVSPVSVLDRKLMRDLWRLRGQALAIALVISGGVAAFVFAFSTLESLTRTRDAYYDRYRFAHVFASAKRAPRALEARLREIPGVAEVETRVVVDVTLTLDGLAEPASGRLISIPDLGRPRLNDVFLVAGRWPEFGRSEEVLIGEAFAEAHGFEPEDSLVALLNGRRRTLRIVGIALSPEHVYSIRPGDLFPDPLHFGILWMPESGLAAAYDMKGAFNDLVLRTGPGGSEDRVLREIDRLLEPFGARGAIAREHQLSHWYLSAELRQLQTTGTFVPIMFLGVAVFLLHIVLGRLIRLERDQIAILKAFGYHDREVGVHYLKFGASIVAVGAALGVVVGAWLGRGMTELYTEFFRFPELDHHLSIAIVLKAFAVAAVAGATGTFGAVRRATQLPPAEAMRPEPPTVYRPTTAERWGLQRWFDQPTRMVLRHVERQPIKSLLTSLGVGLAVAILVVGLFIVDALDEIVSFQFERAQREDMTVTFIEPTSFPALAELAHLPGVEAAEPYRSVAVRMRHAQRERQMAIVGLIADPQLHRVMDRTRAVTLPEEGVVISEKLREILAVEVGDRVEVEVLEGNRAVREVVVAGTIDDYFGLSAFMEIDALRRLLLEGNTLTGAFLRVDPEQAEELYRAARERPRVAAASLTTAAYDSFKETLAQNLLIITSVNAIFASIIALGVVYNSARIALSERSRELATLRVLGFGRGEISYILLGELALLTAFALPLGCGLGYFLADLLIRELDTEVYRIPLIVSTRTYVFACSVVVLATVVSGAIVRRRLDHLDLVAVLKSRE